MASARFLGAPRESCQYDELAYALIFAPPRIRLAASKALLPVNLNRRPRPSTCVTLAPLPQTEDLLPRFRSAKDFPVKPKQADLPLLYADCLQALKQANQARELLRNRMAMRKESIMQIQNLLGRLENDIALAAKAKVRVHALNELLVGELAKYEQVADDFVSVSSEAQLAPRTGLKFWIEKLKSLSKRWHSIRLEKRDSIAQALQRLNDV